MEKCSKYFEFVRFIDYNKSYKPNTKIRSFYGIFL